MSRGNRSFLLFALAPVVLLGGMSAVQAAPTRWSDPATWPNGKVPVAGSPARR
jgi:hypothetical protein